MKCFTFRQNRLLKHNTNQPYQHTLSELRYVNNATPYQVYEYNREKNIQKIVKKQTKTVTNFNLNICNYNNNAKTVRRSRNFKSSIIKSNNSLMKTKEKIKNSNKSNCIKSERIYKVKNYLQLTIHKCIKSSGIKGKEHSYICSSAQTETSFPYIKSI